MPTPVTIAVLLVSGFCIFTAVYFHAVYFMMARRYPDRLTFGMMTALGAAFASAMLFQLKAQTPEAYRLALLAYLGVFIPNFYIFLKFTCYYTGHGSRRFTQAAGIATLVLWLVHWSRPYGLVTDGLREFGTYQLPWGESVSIARAIPSMWVAPFYLYLFGGLGFAFNASLQHVRKHNWRAGKGFLFSVGVSFLASANNLFVDLGKLRGPYLSEAAILAFILLMTLAVAAEWRDQDLFYGHVFDNQNDAILVLDPVTGEVVQANRTAHTMLRGSSDVIQGQSPFDIGNGRSVLSQTRLVEAIGLCVARGSHGYDGQATRSDGSLMWLDISLNATTFRGEARILAVLRDITERRQLEQERQRMESRLQHAQRLESLGLMAGGVAHDFNNILTAIEANLELVERSSAPGSTANDSIDAIHEAVHRAADLCRQLLAFAGKGSVHPGFFSLGEALRDVGKMVKVAVRKPIKWEYEIAHPLPPLHGDVTQIRQVILNLLTNAADAIPQQGGRVLSMLRVSPTPDGRDPGTNSTEMLCLEIADSGCGMSAETCDHIFDPFFTTKGTGRGLGLAAVQGIIRSHGGTIQVASRLGEGTTMTVLLPVRRSDTTGGPPPSDERTAMGPAGLAEAFGDAVGSRQPNQHHSDSSALAKSSDLKVKDPT